MTRHFTPAQRRALMALPADGSWLTTVTGVAAALYSLKMAHGDLCVGLWQRKPREGYIWRLTEAGIEERRRMQESGE